MRDIDTGRHALFFNRGNVRFHDAAALTLVDERGECRVVFRSMCRKRVLGGNRTESDAHDGVGAGGEDPEETSLCSSPLSPALSRKGRGGQGTGFAG